MKRASFRVGHGRGGWLRTTLAPLNDRQTNFRTVDIVMFGTLIGAVVAIARVLIAH